MNKRLLDGGEYIPSTSTDIAKTWRKFGFKATTDAERKARQRRNEEQPAPNVLPITTRRKAK